MAGSYALQAMDAGLIGLVFSNASPAMPPWGGREALLGTSPLAAGAPGGKRGPFLLDMSPAVAARGKIRRALRRGEIIPLGYALDAEGRPTTDPAAALGGVVLPIGAYKGSGLSMLMDIFGGRNLGRRPCGPRRRSVQDVRPAAGRRPFLPGDAAESVRLRGGLPCAHGRLIERVRDCPKAEGFDEILIPGEPEAREEAKRQRTGIPYSVGDIMPVQEEAARAGVAPLRLSEHPLG